MGEDDRKRAVDAFAWSLNIFASVAIVMVNKQLMGSSGFGFSFGELLLAIQSQQITHVATVPTQLCFPPASASASLFLAPLSFFFPLGMRQTLSLAPSTRTRTRPTCDRRGTETKEKKLPPSIHPPPLHSKQPPRCAAFTFCAPPPSGAAPGAKKSRTPTPLEKRCASPP